MSCIAAFQLIKKQNAEYFFASALLFLSLQQCTDFNHVYKLEAIDCSYLCCAGGGQEMGLTEKNDHLAPPADRIWDMALSMLAVAAHGSRLPGTVGSTEPGGKVVLKIGIHTGRYMRLVLAQPTV